MRHLIRSLDGCVFRSPVSVLGLANFPLRITALSRMSARVEYHQSPPSQWHSAASCRIYVGLTNASVRRNHAIHLFTAISKINHKSHKSFTRPNLSGDYRFIIACASYIAIVISLFLRTIGSSYLTLVCLHPHICTGRQIILQMRYRQILLKIAYGDFDFGRARLYLRSEVRSALAIKRFINALVFIYFS